MKQKLLLAILISCSWWLTAKAGETEPNNNRNSANTLVLNGGNNGSISAPGDEDWWKITTTSDGDLNLYDSVTNTTAISHQWCWMELYDNNGSTLLYQGYNDVIMKSTIPGLAAGTYYLRIHGDYNSNDGTGTIPDYVLSNTLSAQGNNDAEPNNTRAQAKVLPVGGSRNGHTGYYYNNTRDLADWYKITTTEDGQLNLSFTNGNQQTFVNLYLYDNDGTTLLQSGANYTAINLVQTGLAAGTYYAKVVPEGDNNYYQYHGWSTYTLNSSLAATGVANDAEPNGTYTQGANLAINGSTTGHIGYYYNNQRDSADWYKVVLQDDGYLSFTVTPQGNGTEYMYAYLFDGDGATVLSSGYHYCCPFSFNKDGLAAGTYYLKLNMGPGATGLYTISNSFSTYTNATEAAEQNDYYGQAKTLPANGTVTGHVDFYYNHYRDTADYWKINYTGSGALTLNVSLNNWISNGQGHYFYVQVYKDTISSPIFNNYFFNASGDINLTGLTQGYYWVRIIMSDYFNEFGAYSLANTFTQSKASIKLTGADTATTCTNTSTLAFKCSKSQPPYTVQLYRYGVAYGSARIVTNTNTFTFNNLPQGSYYATAYGDGATGTAFGKSPTINVMPPVTGTLNTTNIMQTSAKTNWTALSCAKFYAVQYHKAGESAWLTKYSNGNTGSATLTGLTANTTYRWRVQAADSVGNIVATSKFTDSVTFTTATLFASANDGSETNAIANTKPVGSVAVYPNPASAQIKLQVHNAMSNQPVSAVLKDMNGNILWSIQNVPASSLNGKTIDVSKFSNGIYILQVTDKNQKMITAQKIAVAH